MNVNDLPFPEAGGSCIFRLPDTLHCDDAPYIRYIPAGTELTLVTTTAAAGGHPDNG
jgi:hypothetical protein